MFGFRRRDQKSTGVSANLVSEVDGEKVVDVRGQTCPGYLLAINRAVDKFTPDTLAQLWITYPPCGDDVRAWAKARGHTMLGMEYQEGLFVIRLKIGGERQN